MVQGKSQKVKKFALEKTGNVGIATVILFFILCLGLGILVGLKLLEDFGVQKQELVPISGTQFLLNFVLGLCLVLIIIFLGQRFKTSKKFLLKALFLLSVALGSFICLGVFIGDLAIFPVIILILFWLKRPNVLLQDILVILAIAGAGSLLGIQMEPETVVFLLIIFSVYDYIAVFKTKHMVKMAKEMLGEQAILGLVLPQKTSDFWASLKQVQPGRESFFILGGGDIVFPLIMSASVLVNGLLDSLIIALFALIGLLFNFCFFTKQKKRQALPALPLIALFCIIGFFITKLI